MRRALLAMLLVALAWQARAETPKPKPFCPASLSYGQMVILPSGFRTAQECKDSSDFDLTAYTRAAVDGLLASGLLGASPSCIRALQQCFIGKNDQQLAAVVRKYILQHPEAWNVPCAAEAAIALFEMCRAQGYSPK